MKSCRVLLLLVLLCVTATVAAQTIRLSNIGINDGLSQSMVSCIFRDSRGFIWIGTGDGLNRYDGTQCIVYKSRFNDPYAISNNAIRRIMEDPYGNIWIGTDGGLNRFDRKTNRFHHIFSHAYFAITPLIVEQDSLLWFMVHGKGLGYYNILSNELKTFYAGPSSALWASLGTSECTATGIPHIYRIASNQGVIRMITDPVNPICERDTLFDRIVPKQMTNEIIEDEHEVWVSSVTGTVCYDKRTKHFTSYDGLDRICRDISGNLRASSFSGGLFIFDRSSKRFNPVSVDQDAGLPGMIRSLYADKCGNLWIGTDGKGLYHYSPSCNKFNWYNTATHFTPAGQKLGGDFIKCFAKDWQNRLWVGTHNHGINIIDLNGNRLFPVNNPWLARQIVHALYNDGTVMWIGTDSGLYTCNMQTFALKHIATGPERMSVYHIAKLRNGSIMACTVKGVYLGTNPSNTYMEKISGTDYKASYGYEDLNGKLWIATGYYTYSILPPYKQAKREILRSGNQEILDFASKNFVEDPQGILWIGGKKGLIRYDRQNNTQTLFTEQNGLADAMVYGILIDASGRIWLSSNKGLSCFDPQKKIFTHYDMQDGLQSNEFNSGAYFKDEKGMMYFGGVNGFNVFDPLHIPVNRHAPSVNLTGIKIFDLDYYPGIDYSELKQIDLHHYDNTLSFEFAAMNLSNPGRNRYAYMLEGEDQNWVTAGTRRFVRYANLRPGAYTLKVKAANNDGIWSEPRILLHIRIAYPWWFRWWAVTASVIIIGTCIYFSVRYLIGRKLKKQQREVEKLQAVNHERSRISKDMHDDLGSGLSRIAVMSELLKQQLHQDKNEQVEKISKTASDLIDNMSHIIWAMNPENDHISNLLAYIREHAVEFMESCGLQCELLFPEQTPEITLTQEARRNIFLVVKESLNNIVKHASAKNVSISVSVTGKLMILTIKDDGAGFDVHNCRKNGNGLRNMEKRMDQVNGTYQISSEPGKGTVTTISIVSR